MAGVTSGVLVSSAHPTAAGGAAQELLRRQIFRSNFFVNVLRVIVTLGYFWSVVLADRAKGLEGRIKLIQPLVSREENGFRLPLTESTLATEENIKNLQKNQELKLLAEQLAHDIGGKVEDDHALCATARVVVGCVKGQFIPFLYADWQEVVKDFQKEIAVERRDPWVLVDRDEVPNQAFFDHSPPRVIIDIR